VCVITDRNAKCAGQTKVGELEVALRIDEEILGLQIPVQYTMLVAVVDSL
jgi:hypothetical protein